MVVRTIKGGLLGEDEVNDDFNMDIMNLKDGDAAMACVVLMKRKATLEMSLGRNVVLLPREVKFP